MRSISREVFDRALSEITASRRALEPKRALELLAIVHRARHYDLDRACEGLTVLSQDDQELVRTAAVRALVVAYLQSRRGYGKRVRLEAVSSAARVAAEKGLSPETMRWLAEVLV